MLEIQEIETDGSLEASSGPSVFNDNVIEQIRNKYVHSQSHFALAARIFHTFR